jgi:hypothetical protein
VLNVNNGDTISRFISNILFHKQIRENNWLTDEPIDGIYTSNWDGSNLYFVFRSTDTSYTMLDSMTNIIVKKSQGKPDDPCYEDDPNIQIDQLSFTHAGVIKGKNDVVVLGR